VGAIVEEDAIILGCRDRDVGSHGNEPDVPQGWAVASQRQFGACLSFEARK
jgi:hypothetical protein